MSDIKVNMVEDIKYQTINEYDRKDIITKQGVDKAFLNKVNRNVTYKRKLGQTNRRYNYETIERLKQSYENQENERIHAFSSEYDTSKFTLDDFSQILESDIGDLMDSSPENNKKMQELQALLKDMYQKRNINKEPPKDINELLNLWQNLQKQAEVVIKGEKQREAEEAAKDVTVVSVEDYSPNEDNEVPKIKGADIEFD